MRRELLHVRHCLWCGVPIATSQAYFCSSEHIGLQARWAAEHYLAPPRRCPTPEKRVTRYRGTALRWAVVFQRNPYRCECGSFHLTSNPKSAQRYEESLAQLAVALHLPFPSRTDRLARYKERKVSRRNESAVDSEIDVPRETSSGTVQA